MTEQEALDRTLGMRIARFLNRKTGDYIKKHYNELWGRGDRKREQIWDAQFNESDHFPFNLDADILINIYKDSILARYIYDGVFEKDETLAVKQLLKKGDTFLDIGANIGFYSLMASSIVGDSGCVHSIEPTPETYRRLEENVKLNSFQNIKCHQIALSDKNGDALFNVSEDGHDAWNSFANLNELGNNLEKIKVQTILLDQFLETHNISNIKLVKIDVEGWELFVFKGAKNLLSKEDAPILMVEFTEENTFAAGYYCGELYDYITSFGYKWYRYDVVNKSFNEEKKLLHYPYENLFAIKTNENLK